MSLLDWVAVRLVAVNESEVRSDRDCRSEYG